VLPEEPPVLLEALRLLSRLLGSRGRAVRLLLQWLRVQRRSLLERMA
jgi:hypothetical protein